MESEKVNYADKNEQLWSAALAGEEERVLSLIAEGANLSGYKKVNTDNYRFNITLLVTLILLLYSKLSRLKEWYYRIDGGKL